MNSSTFGMTRRDVLRLIPLAVLGGLCRASACGGYGDFSQLVARREAVERASRFLISAQSTDGAWRSGHYGFFRGGDALTPVVLHVLTAGVPGLVSGTAQALARGAQWLDALTDRIAAVREPWAELKYPLFSASYAARYYAGRGDVVRAGVWADMIEGLQHTERLGWAKGEPRFGGWSDAPRPPHRPDGETFPDMVNPNLSATAFAILGLVAAGRVDPARLAIPFVEHCQNWRNEGRDAGFDDGGFIFALDDPARNKAGVAGTDATGKKRYRSYGSATCDGMLSLLALGRAHDDERVTKALHWLRGFPATFHHPGNWPADRVDSGRALLFYHAQALAEVLRRQQSQSWVSVWRANLWRGLIRMQGSNGAWANADAESCEDDPIVATAFALHALVG